MDDTTSVYKNIHADVRKCAIDADPVRALKELGLTRAARLYDSASSADGNADALTELAAALELLETGLRLQFEDRPEGPYGNAAANLSLIKADRLYAKALSSVVALGDDRFVAVLCDALAAASEGRAWPEQPGSADNRNALYQAAGSLAELLETDRN